MSGQLPPIPRTKRAHAQRHGVALRAHAHQPPPTAGSFIGPLQMAHSKGSGEAGGDCMGLLVWTRRSEGWCRSVEEMSSATTALASTRRRFGDAEGPSSHSGSRDSWRDRTSRRRVGSERERRWPGSSRRAPGSPPTWSADGAITSSIPTPLALPDGCRRAEHPRQWMGLASKKADDREESLPMSARAPLSALCGFEGGTGRTPSATESPRRNLPLDLSGVHVRAEWECQATTRTNVNRVAPRRRRNEVPYM